MEHMTLRRGLMALVGITVALAGLLAAGTPLTHGTLDDHAIEQLDEP